MIKYSRRKVGGLIHDKASKGEEMNRKVIALSSTPIKDGYVKVTEKYLDAIFAAEGIPMLLSPKLEDEYISNVCKTVDGFLFCGGDDIDPKYYGEEKSELLGNTCSIRDEFEYKLFAAAYKTSKPMLGICRGLQVFNVFLGGSLCQHVEGHKQSEARDILTHAVTLTDDGLLNKILRKDSIAVNSFHHQVIRELAQGLAVDGISTKDGYVEAFHHVTHPFLLGVQWHPECYYDISDTSSMIFEEFIKACN